MEIQDILSLIQAVDEHGLTELKLDSGDAKLSLKREYSTIDNRNMVITEMPEADKSVSTSTEKIIKSPLVGTFYYSPSPEAEAFVKAGDTVKKGQTLGIIEAMKLMNEIECEYDGTVEAVLVDNEAIVEYGQPLFSIR